MTNKNRGIDIKEACIHCQDSQILTEVMCMTFATPFRSLATYNIIMANRSRPVTNHTRPLVSSWLIIRHQSKDA